jgi:drug/metabolite transporter (DMT)-like permease
LAAAKHLAAAKQRFEKAQKRINSKDYTGAIKDHSEANEFREFILHRRHRKRGIFLYINKLRSIKLFLAYLATYLVWGSTAFAISLVVQYLPPLYSSALRYFGAGIIIVYWCTFWRHRLPQGKEWINTFMMPFLLLAVSNSSTSWSCKYVPSSIVVVIQSIIPLIMIVLDRIFFHQEKQLLLNYFCVCAGIIGVSLSVFSKDPSGTRLLISPFVVFVLMVGSFSGVLCSLLLKICPKIASNFFFRYHNVYQCSYPNCSGESDG